MNRIDERFEKLKREGKKAFIPYICAGDPTLEDTKRIVHALEEAGADIIELGVPYSDPLADGSVIQAADLRSLGNGFKIDGLFETIADIRNNSQVPLAVMVYYSSIIGYGKGKFIDKCEQSGVDGIIVPDLPYEEYDELKPLVDKTGVYMIPLIAITSGERIPMLVEGAKGFIYCVSSLGVTGARAEFDTRVDKFIENVKSNTNIPACVGFGITDRSTAERFEKVADGVIVGSAIVKNIFENKTDLDKLKEFVKELKG